VPISLAIFMQKILFGEKLHQKIDLIELKALGDGFSTRLPVLAQLPGRMC
jgi:hypothetical protein